MKLIPTTVLISLLTQTLFAQLPPTQWFTNFFKLELWTATDGVNFTNPYGGSVVWNVSTNFPWANNALGFPYYGNPPGNWSWYTGYPTNQVRLTWSWPQSNGLASSLVKTNFLMATNATDGSADTLLTFTVYPPPPGTNGVTHWVSYRTDGNTLSFSHNLNGPWTWSGANNYRQPSYNLIYEFVQGVSTDGSVSPVHLHATNETWEDGVLIKASPVF